MKYVENVMEMITDGITVANLRRTDIQKVSTYNYTQYKHEPSEWKEITEEKDGLIYFGQSKTDTTNSQYPAMWKNFDSQWTYGYDGTNETGSDKECEMWEKENGYETENGTSSVDNSTNFKQSYYAHDYKDEKKEFINEKYYNLLFNDTDDVTPLEESYWIAGRYVLLRDWCIDFGLQAVSATSSNCFVNGDLLYRSVRY